MIKAKQLELCLESFKSVRLPSGRIQIQIMFSNGPDTTAAQMHYLASRLGEYFMVELT